MRADRSPHAHMRRNGRLGIRVAVEVHVIPALRAISPERKKGDIFKLVVFFYPAILLLLIVVTFGAFVWTGR